MITHPNQKLNELVTTPSKTAQQVAALPFVVIDNAVEILLITSRRRERWIMPKGWPEKDMTLAQSAANEAWEEAGVRGSCGKKPMGRYDYIKLTQEGGEIPMTVLVYPLLVRCQCLDWPERGERKTKWHSIAEAIAVLDDRDLSKLLSKLARGKSEKLLKLAGNLGQTDWAPPS